MPLAKFAFACVLILVGVGCFGIGYAQRLSDPVSGIAIPANKEQLLGILRTMRPGELALIGYAGSDGLYHQLTYADLACAQKPQ